MTKSGCIQIDFGVERGSDQALRFIKKGTTIKKTIEIFDLCHKYGIRRFANMLINVPGETRKHLLKTVLLNWRIGPDFAMTSIFYPFKGTEMGDLCYKEGRVNLKKKEMVGSYANDTILDHPNISTLEMKIAKYPTTFSAMRSRKSFFYNVLLERARKIFLMNLGLFNR